MRLAFVGDPQRFSSWVMHAPAGGVTPAFVAPFDRDAPARLRTFRPDVVVALAHEQVGAVPHSSAS